MQLTTEHSFRGHLRPVWGSLLPWKPVWGRGFRKLLLTVPFPPVSFVSTLYFFWLPALSVSTLSSVSCSPGAILGLHTLGEGMFSSVGLSQYLPGWPFVLSILLAFVWLQVPQSEEAEPIHSLSGSSWQSSYLGGAGRWWGWGKHGGPFVGCLLQCSKHS